MKRWVVVALVTLAVLVLISPGIIGWIMERDLADNIARSRLESPAITISTEDFERGWFSSTGRHRIEFSDRGAFPLLANFVGQAGYAAMPALILDSRIDHGLVALGSMSSDNGSMTPGIARLVATLQLDPGNGELIDLPGQVYITIGLMGETHAKLVLEEGRWDDGDISISWQGIALKMSLDTNGALTSIDGFVAPVRLSAGGGNVVLGRIEVVAEQQPSAYDFNVGTVRLNSGAVSITDRAGSTSGYASLAFTAASDIVDGALSGNARLDISGITVPTLGAIDIGFDLAYSGFDAESFTLLYAAFQAAAKGGNPNDAFAALYPSMDAELQQFLSAGAELHFDRLNISLPQGVIETDLRFSLPAAGRGDAFSWPGLLLKAKASINLTLPTALYDMLLTVQPEAGMAVAAGFLILHDDVYTMRLEYSQGLATVNGLPMRVPMPGMR